MKPLLYKKNPLKGICSALYCQNRTDRTLCGSCRCRKSRLADPVRYAFNNSRNRARQRGIEFTITLEWFRQFCHKVKYIGFKNRCAEGYSLDRIKNELGYVPGNIQILTVRENVKKYFTYDYQSKHARITTVETIDNTDNPF